MVSERKNKAVRGTLDVNNSSPSKTERKYRSSRRKVNPTWGAKLAAAFKHGVRFGYARKLQRVVRKSVVHRLSVEDAEIIANIERCEIAINVLRSVSTFGSDKAIIDACIKDIEYLRR